MADDTDSAITAAVAGITEPTPPDPKGLLDIAASVRQQIASAKGDPTHPAFGKPDVIAKMEQGLVISLARANVTEPVFNPQAAAEAAHDASFTFRSMNENLADLIDDRLEALETGHTERQITDMASALRTQLGAAAYDKMIAEAQAGLNPGETLPPAVTADLVTLKLLAGQGRYNLAYENTKPRSVT